MCADLSVFDQMKHIDCRDKFKPMLIMMQKEDIGFSVLLRACVRVGRFFVTR
jgi:hypothetical protein